MKEQIKILISEVTKLKHGDSNKEQRSPSKNYKETESKLTPPPPPTSSPRKYRILPRNNIIFYLQYSKNFAGRLLPDNRGMTKSELKKVKDLIQNTMQTLAVFGKRFSEE